MGGAGLINLAVGAEHLQPPLFTGQPGDDTGLDGRKVSVNEDVALRGNKSGADELAEGIRYGAIDRFEAAQVALAYKVTGKGQGLRIGAGEVLDLHQPPSPAPRAVGPIELEQPTDPLVRAHSGLYGVILLGGGLAQLLADFKHTGHLGAVAVLFQQADHRVLAQVPQLLPGFLLEPFGELGHAVGVVEAGQAHGLRHEVLAHGVPQVESPGHHLHVHGHATGIDDEVRFPLLLHPVRDGVGGQPPVNFHFGDHILAVVLLEKLPLGGVMLGQVAGAATVGLGGGAGRTEITDEGLAGVQLALVLQQPQGPPSGLQARRIAAVKAMEHGAPPLVRRQPSQEFGQTAPLKGGVVCVLDKLRAGDGLDQPRGQVRPRGQVYYLNRCTIQAVCEKQNFKVRAGDVLLSPGLGNRDAGKGFKVNAQMVHSAVLS